MWTWKILTTLGAEHRILSGLVRCRSNTSHQTQAWTYYLDNNRNTCPMIAKSTNWFDWCKCHEGLCHVRKGNMDLSAILCKTLKLSKLMGLSVYQKANSSLTLSSCFEVELIEKRIQLCIASSNVIETKVTCCMRQYNGGFWQACLMILRADTRHEYGLYVGIRSDAEAPCMNKTYLLGA